MRPQRVGKLRGNLELSIDSSTRFASVAVSNQGTVIGERTWEAERNHSVELAPTIRSVMRQASAGPADLSAVFVAKGPGGFSSLRVGMSMAKSLAMGLGVPLVGIGTLEIELSPHLPADMPVCAIVEAGGGRVYAGWSDRPAEALTVVTVPELAELAKELTLFCGEAALENAPTLKELMGDLARLAGREPPTRRAGTLAQLAWSRLETGQTDHPDTLEPLYMRSAQYSVAARTHLG